MQTVTLTARYDGQQIQLDEPYTLEPGTALMVTILPKSPDEQGNWQQFAAQNLAAAYGGDEPDYSVTDLIKPNPTYDGR